MTDKDPLRNYQPIDPRFQATIQNLMKLIAQIPDIEEGDKLIENLINDSTEISRLNFGYNTYPKFPAFKQDEDD